MQTPPNLATVSIADLAILFRAAQNVVSGLEAAGNMPSARGTDVLSDWLDSADAALEAIAAEMKNRVPADEEEERQRFGCLASFAAIVSSNSSEIELHVSAGAVMNRFMGVVA